MARKQLGAAPSASLDTVDVAYLLAAIDNVRTVIIGASASAANATPQVVTCPGTISTGDMLAVTFDNGLDVDSPTLQVNGAPAAPVLTGGVVPTAGESQISSGGVGVFYYDGTNYNLLASTPITYTVVTPGPGDVAGLVTGQTLQSISQNLTTANLSGAALVTSSDTIASNDNNTTLPTSAAVAQYVTQAAISADQVNGTISVVHGGTGAGTLPAGGVLLGNGTSAISSTPATAMGNVLTDTGTGWQSKPLPPPAAGSITVAMLKTTGIPSSTTYLRGDGTWGVPYVDDTGTANDVLVIGPTGTGVADSGLSVPSSAFVGISDTQTLTHKTISGTSNTLENIPLSAMAFTGTPSASTFLDGDGAWATPQATLTGTQGHIPLIGISGQPMTDSGLAVPDSALVGVSDTQTLINKSISGTTNTLSSIPVNALAVTGTASSSTFLNGSGQWATPSAQSGSAQLGPGSVTMVDLDTTGTASATTFLSGTGAWSIPQATVTGTAGDIPLIGSAGGPLTDSGVGLPDSAIVGVSDTQTLTNKNLTSTTNVFPVLNQNTTGNAATATALASARTVVTNLASTTASSFDGTANITPGIEGTLPLSHGGTGATTASAARIALQLATVANTGAYSDLSGTPTIPAAQVNSDWNATTGVAQILNKPTIPTALTQLDTTVTGTQLNTLYAWQSGLTATATELGYVHGVTSAIQTQLNGKQPTIAAGTTAQYYRGDKTWQTLNAAAVAGLATVATSGSYTDLANQPSIPSALTAGTGISIVSNAISVDPSTVPTLNQSTTGNAATATKLATAITINGVSFDGSSNITIPTGSSYTGGAGISVSGTTISANAATMPTLNQSTTGNAATATKLATPRTINGVPFDGSSNITVSTELTPTSVKTANYTAAVGEMVFVNGSNITITFPASPPDGARVGVTNLSAVTSWATMAPSSGDTLFGAVNYLYGDTSITFRYQSATSTWYPLTGAAPYAAISEYYFGTIGIGQINASGTKSSSTFLRGDGTWNAPATGLGLKPTAQLTANYTAKVGDLVLISSSSSGSLTITLPQAPADGSLVGIYNASSAWGVVAPSGSDATTINRMFSGASLLLQYDASISTWITLSGGTSISALALQSGGQLNTPVSGNLANCTGLPLSGITTTGTASASTYLRGDGTWSTPGLNLTTTVTGASYALSPGELAHINPAGSGTNAILPSVPPNNTVVAVYNGNGKPVNVETVGSDLVAGQTSFQIADALTTTMFYYQAATSNWLVDSAVTAAQAEISRNSFLTGSGVTEVWMGASSALPSSGVTGVLYVCTS